MRRAAIAVLGLLLLSACAEPEDDTGSIEIQGGASSAPTDQTGTLLDNVPDEPQEPKQVKSESGAMDFAVYSNEVMWHALGTSDAELVEEVSDVRYCAQCKTIVQTIKSLEGSLMVTEEPVTVSNVEVTSVDGDLATVRMDRVVPPVGLVDPDQPEKFVDEPSKGIEHELVVNLKWDQDHWVLYRFEPAE